MCAGALNVEGTDTMPQMEYVLHIAAPVRRRVPPSISTGPAHHSGAGMAPTQQIRTASRAVIARWVPRFLMYIKTTSLLTCT